MTAERQVDESELMDVAADPEQARRLHKALRTISETSSLAAAARDVAQGAARRHRHEGCHRDGEVHGGDLRPPPRDQRAPPRTRRTPNGRRSKASSRTGRPPGRDSRAGRAGRPHASAHRAGKAWLRRTLTPLILPEPPVTPEPPSRLPSGDQHAQADQDAENGHEHIARRKPVPRLGERDAPAVVVGVHHPCVASMEGTWAVAGEQGEEADCGPRIDRPSISTSLPSRFAGSSCRCCG